MTTVVRPWFGRGTSNLARECDRPRGSGLRPKLEDVRPVQTRAAVGMDAGVRFRRFG